MTRFDSTRAATFKAIINTLKDPPRATLDAAFRLPALVALYAIHITFDRLSRRYPRRARTLFLSIMRNGLIIIVLTIASLLYCHHRRSASGKCPMKNLQTVPRGFQVKITNYQLDARAHRISSTSILRPSIGSLFLPSLRQANQINRNVKEVGF